MSPEALLPHDTRYLACVCEFYTRKNGTPFDLENEMIASLFRDSHKRIIDKLCHDSCLAHHLDDMRSTHMAHACVRAPAFYSHFVKRNWRSVEKSERVKLMAVFTFVFFFRST